jgi:hypothetical protein
VSFTPEQRQSFLDVARRIKVETRMLHERAATAVNTARAICETIEVARNNRRHRQEDRLLRELVPVQRTGGDTVSNCR